MIVIVIPGGVTVVTKCLLVLLFRDVTLHVCRLFWTLVKVSTEQQLVSKQQLDLLIKVNGKTNDEWQPAVKACVANEIWILKSSILDNRRLMERKLDQNNLIQYSLQKATIMRQDLRNANGIFFYLKISNVRTQKPSTGLSILHAHNGFTPSTACIFFQEFDRVWIGFFVWANSHCTSAVLPLTLLGAPFQKFEKGGKHSWREVWYF